MSKKHKTFCATVKKKQIIKAQKKQENNGYIKLCGLQW